MNFEPITEVEVTNLILSLNVSKFCGHDDISPLIVKDCCSILCKPLVYLYNLDIELGVVPEDLKIPKVIPIFKKEYIFLPSNYRPILLLSIFHKLLGKLVHRRAYNFLSKKKYGMTCTV